MAGAHLAKRIPSIKFPQRHPKPAVSGSSAPKSQEQAPSSYDDLNAKLLSWTRVPSPPANTAVGGKASLLPERRPLSEKEMEIILSLLMSARPKMKAAGASRLRGLDLAKLVDTELNQFVRPTSPAEV